MMKAVGRSDLAFKDISTRYSTNSMHLHLTAMATALATKMVKDTEPEIPLDPFCWGGAVCVEGVRAGVPTSGPDINLLSDVINSARAMRIDKAVVQQHTEVILNEGSRIQITNTDVK